MNFFHGIFSILDNVNTIKMTAPIWKVSISLEFKRNDQLDTIYNEEIEEALNSGKTITSRRLIEKRDSLESEEDYTQEDIYEYLWEDYEGSPRFLELTDLLFTNFYQTKIIRRVARIEMIHGQAVIVIIFDTKELIDLKKQNRRIDTYTTEKAILVELMDMSLEDTFYESSPGNALVIPSKNDETVALGYLDFRSWTNIEIERVTDLTGEVLYDEEYDEVDLDDDDSLVKNPMLPCSL